MNFLEQSFDGQNQSWKYIIVFLTVLFVAQIIGVIPLLCVVIYKASTFSGNIVINPDNMMDFTIFGMSKNMSLSLLLFSSIVSFLATVLLIKLQHNRTFTATVNGTSKFRMTHCLAGVAVWAILMALYLLGDYVFNKENYILQFNLTGFIPLLVISLIFIPFQTTFEELLFRGYLAQGVAGWTKKRWLAILLPSIFFALMHAFNPEVKEFGFWSTMPQYFLLGIFLGFISVLDDGIELAVGIHAINNIFLSLLTTNKSSVLQTDAVFEQININPIKETLWMTIMVIVAIIWFSIKYKWDFNILKKKVAPNI